MPAEELIPIDVCLPTGNENYPLSPDLERWDVSRDLDICCTFGGITALVAPFGLALVFLCCVLYCPKVERRGINCHGLSFWLGMLGLGFVSVSIFFFALGSFDTISELTRFVKATAVICDMTVESPPGRPGSFYPAYYIAFELEGQVRTSRVLGDAGHSEEYLNNLTRHIRDEVIYVVVWYDPARTKVVRVERDWTVPAVSGLALSGVSLFGIVLCCGGLLRFLRRNISFRKASVRDMWDVCLGREGPLAVDLELLTGRL